MVIETAKISKTYQLGTHEVHALRGVTVSVDRGEMVAIRGPSGSGKSTFMNILGCLDRPSSGSYMLDGRDVSALSRGDLASVRNTMIGFVFQNFNLLPRVTARENVELPLLYAGASGRERESRSLEALREVGLEARAGHFPSQLSGGEQQRVAVARALATRPSVILADEPTGNLDTRTSLEILALLQDLNIRRGVTIILVTHEADIAACARRSLFFRDGHLIEDRRNDALRDAATELRRLPVEVEEVA
jgi:putative ABC transport system ATP-binding protein